MRKIRTAWPPRLLVVLLLSALATAEPQISGNGRLRRALQGEVFVPVPAASNPPLRVKADPANPPPCGDANPPDSTCSYVIAEGLCQEAWVHDYYYCAASCRRCKQKVVVNIGSGGGGGGGGGALAVRVTAAAVKGLGGVTAKAKAKGVGQATQQRQQQKGPKGSVHSEHPRPTTSPTAGGHANKAAAPVKMAGSKPASHMKLSAAAVHAAATPTPAARPKAVARPKALAHPKPAAHLKPAAKALVGAPQKDGALQGGPMKKKPLKAGRKMPAETPTQPVEY